MESGEGNYFTAADGAELYYERWGADQPSRFQVLFLHGVNESADTKSVQRLAHACTDAQISFYCLEHHGHGRSVGRGTLGLVESFDRCDIVAVLTTGRSLCNNCDASAGDELVMTGCKSTQSSSVGMQ